MVVCFSFASLARVARRRGAASLLPDPHAGSRRIEQRHIIESHLQDAKAKGAKTECGGGIIEHNGGLWCEPTVLSNVNHDMLVMTEETFGPVLPVMAFSTDQEAISLANERSMGYRRVFPNDVQRPGAIAKKLDAAGSVSMTPD